MMSKLTKLASDGDTETRNSALYVWIKLLNNVSHDYLSVQYCQTPDLDQGLEFDFTFAMEQEQ